MLKELTKHKGKYALALLLVAALACVRVFERDLFYDPFLHYFEGDYLKQGFPAYDHVPLAGNLLARYALNTAISLGLLWVLFRNASELRFAAILYLIAALLLLPAFFALLAAGPHYNFLLFYVRRFLIQPLLVLLFIPAFYYQRRMVKNNNS